MVYNHGSGLKLPIDVVGGELVLVAASFSRQPQVSHKSATSQPSLPLVPYHLQVYSQPYTMLIIQSKPTSSSVQRQAYTMSSSM